MTTATKGIRLTEAEQDLLAAVTASNSLHFRSEADALRVAALVGLRVLGVRGILVGEPIPLVPAQLAASLAIELMPVYEFLAQHDKLPVLIQRNMQAVSGSPLEPAPLPPAPPVVAPEASQTLRAFGTLFLDDEDDD